MRSAPLTGRTNPQNSCSLSIPRFPCSTLPKPGEQDCLKGASRWPKKDLCNAHNDTISTRRKKDHERREARKMCRERVSSLRSQCRRGGGPRKCTGVCRRQRRRSPGHRVSRHRRVPPTTAALAWPSKKARQSLARVVIASGMGGRSGGLPAGPLRGPALAPGAPFLSRAPKLGATHQLRASRFLSRTPLPSVRRARPPYPVPFAGAGARRKGAARLRRPLRSFPRPTTTPRPDPRTPRSPRVAFSVGAPRRPLCSFPGCRSRSDKEGCGLGRAACGCALSRGSFGQ